MSNPLVSYSPRGSSSLALPRPAPLDWTRHVLPRSISRRTKRNFGGSPSSTFANRRECFVPLSRRVHPAQSALAHQEPYPELHRASRIQSQKSPFEHEAELCSTHETARPNSRNFQTDFERADHVEQTESHRPYCHPTLCQPPMTKAQTDLSGTQDQGQSGLRGGKRSQALSPGADRRARKAEEKRL